MQNSTSGRDRLQVLRRCSSWVRRGVLCFILLSTFSSFAQLSRISSDLQNLTAGLNVKVIVRYSHVPTQLDFLIATANGAVLQQQLPLINAASYTMLAGNVLTLLNADPDILYISLDRPLGGLLDYAGSTVGADIASNMGYDGSGVGVAVIDSGITVVQDLKAASGKSNRVLMSQNFASGSTTSDLYGHGDHVAGIIAGNGANSSCPTCFKTFRGIAPNANLVNLRVLDQNGSGSDSSVIAAIQKAVDLKSTYNIRVINLSLGRPVFESYTNDPLCKAVEAAWKAGVVVVVAAGNYGRDNSNGREGYATITSPGNDPYVITVGAMKTMATADRGDDLIATYSSKGPSMLDHVVKPDLVAPGNLIISDLSSVNSTLYTQYPQNAIPQSYYKTGPNLNSAQYYRLSGTSMAAPMVSGAAALLLQRSPSLTPDQVKARLMKTAYKNSSRPRASAALKKPESNT